MKDGFGLDWILESEVGHIREYMGMLRFVPIQAQDAHLEGGVIKISQRSCYFPLVFDRYWKNGSGKVRGGAIGTVKIDVIPHRTEEKRGIFFPKKEFFVIGTSIALYGSKIRVKCSRNIFEKTKILEEQTYVLPLYNCETLDQEVVIGGIERII